MDWAELHKKIQYLLNILNIHDKTFDNFLKEFKNKFNAYEDGQRIKDSDRKSIDEQMDGMWKNFVNDNLAEKILLTERDDLILDIKKLHKGTKGFF